MTRKHYNGLADIIAKALNKTDRYTAEERLAIVPEVLAIAEDIMALCKQDNPGFKRERFVKYINARREGTAELLTW